MEEMTSEKKRGGNVLWCWSWLLIPFYGTPTNYLMAGWVYVCITLPQYVSIGHFLHCHLSLDHLLHFFPRFQVHFIPSPLHFFATSSTLSWEQQEYHLSFAMALVGQTFFPLEKHFVQKNYIKDCLDPTLIMLSPRTNAKPKIIIPLP